MKKLISLFFVLLVVILTGCLPQATAMPTATSTATTTPQALATVDLNTLSEAPILPDSGCTAVTLKPTPGSTTEPPYPPVTEADHTKGPANARVTIVEYSDFQ